MAILNFPHNPQTGDQYTGDNGSTYVFDGVKWLGAAIGAFGANTITSNGHSLSVGTDGVITFPLGDNNINKQRYGMGNLVAYLDGEWTLGEYNGSNFGTVGMRINPGIEGQTDIRLPSDANSANTSVSISNYNTGGVLIQSSNKSWTFGQDGYLNLPNGADNAGALLQSASPIRINSNSHFWTFGTDGYLTGESLHLEGFLKGVDGSTGSTGQVLTRQSNGGVAWANATSGSGSVVAREINFPSGVSGDTQGTIALTNNGSIFVCTSTWTASATVTYSATNNTGYSIGQSGGQLLAYEITPSTLPDIQAVFGTWATGQQYNYPTPGDFTIEVPGITGARTVTSCGYLSGNGDIWFDIAYVSGDPTTVSIGDTITIHFTPQQPPIWEQISTGGTGNIKFSGHSITTAQNQSINIRSTTNSGGDTELDINTNNIDLYTWNYSSNSGAELYLDVSDTAHPYAYIGVQTNGSNEKTWTFNKDGNIVFPDQTVQTTAYLGPTVTNPLVWAVQATSTTKASYTQAVAYDSQGNSVTLMWQGPWGGPGETKSSIVKLDANGNTIWSIDLANGTSVNPWSLCCDVSNNVYVIVQRNTGSAWNNVVVKLDGGNGGIIWQTDIQDSQSSNNMQAVPMVYSANGLSFDGIVVAGTAYNGNNNDFFIAFISNDGTAPAPTSLFGDQWEQSAYSIAVNNATGDILMVGREQSNTDTHYYLEMVKLNITSPTAIWQKKVSVTGDTNYNVQATDCCLLADGNWAILSTHDQNNNRGIITMKVNNTDGSIMWSREISAGCSAISGSMGTDANGHIYITASTLTGSSSTNNAPVFNRVLGAYDTNGNILWQQYFKAPGDNWFIDANWWNGIGSTGKAVAVNNTSLLIGSILSPINPNNGPMNSMGVVAQLTLLGESETIGPFQTSTSSLTDAAVSLTIADTAFTFSQGAQTIAAGSTVSGSASTLGFTLFHSGSRPNQLANGNKTVTLQSNGILVNEAGRNVTGELDRYTDSGNQFSNVPIGIKNASGYKRLLGVSSTAQTWLNLNDVGAQLGINPSWINGMIIDYQVLNTNYGIGSMTGQIVLSSNQNYAMNVSHIESAITESNSQSDVVFANLNIWQVNGGTLEAIRTDSVNSQQLDFIWTAKVFYNASEAYC